MACPSRSHRDQRGAWAMSPRLVCRFKLVSGATSGIGHLAFFCEVSCMCSFLHRSLDHMKFPGLAVLDLQHAMRCVSRFRSQVLVFPACKRLKGHLYPKPPTRGSISSSRVQGLHYRDVGESSFMFSLPHAQSSSSSSCPKSTNQRSHPPQDLTSSSPSPRHQ
jgi:hypothetical protein